MRLQPARPPGRSSRKALDYESEIKNLHAKGYSLEAIRRALAAVGVQVSRATVRREATRPARSIPSVPSVAVKSDADAPYEIDPAADEEPDCATQPFVEQSPR